MRTFAAVVVLSSLAAGCVGVEVTPSGSGRTATSRAPDCAVEFFRTKPPDRPYDELATLHFSASFGSPSSAQEEIRRKACALGADAVIVVRDFVPWTQKTDSYMSATAVKYRSPAPGGRGEAPVAKMPEGQPL